MLEGNASNKAVNHFSGKDNDNNDQTKFKSWYTTETLAYLTHLLSPNNEVITAIFYTQAKNGGAPFKDQFLSLGNLCSKQFLNRNFYFIATQPGKFETLHFVFFMKIEQDLWIIDPIGLTQHEHFYTSLLDLKSDESLFDKISNIYISETKIQLDQHGFHSCGPICVELMHHMLSFNKTELHNKLEELANKQTQQKKNELNFISFNAKSILPQSLSGIETRLYKKNIETIREQHLKFIQHTSMNKDENQLALHSLYGSNIQRLMTKLLSKNGDILSLSNTTEYKNLDRLIDDNQDHYEEYKNTLQEQIYLIPSESQKIQPPPPPNQRNESRVQPPVKKKKRIRRRKQKPDKIKTQTITSDEIRRIVNRQDIAVLKETIRKHKKIGNNTWVNQKIVDEIGGGKYKAKVNRGNILNIMLDTQVLFIEGAKLLLRAYPNMAVNNIDRNYGQVPLHRAIEDGDEELVRLLITAGADTNQETTDDMRYKYANYTPLFFCILRALSENKNNSLSGHRILNILLDNGANAAFKNGNPQNWNTPLDVLLWSIFPDGDPRNTRIIFPVFQKLIKAGAIIDNLTPRNQLISKKMLNGHEPFQLYFETLLERLRANVPTLKHFNLGGRGITDKEVAQLVDAMKKNTHCTKINLNSNCCVNPPHCSDKIVWPSLHTSNNINKITNQGAKLISTLNYVISLTLDGNPIGDDGIADIASMPNLQYLSMQYCSLSADGIKEVLNCSKLSTFAAGGANINGTENEIDRFWKTIDDHLENNKCRMDPKHAQSVKQNKLDMKIRDAIHNENIEKLQALISLLQNGVNHKLENHSPTQSYTSLLEACQYNKVKVARYLLSIGANVELHSREYTPLTHAVENGHKNIVKLLLSHGANIRGEFYFNHETPYSIAARKVSSDERLQYKHLQVNLAKISKVLSFKQQIFSVASEYWSAYQKFVKERNKSAAAANGSINNKRFMMLANRKNNDFSRINQLCIGFSLKKYITQDWENRMIAACEKGESFQQFISFVWKGKEDTYRAITNKLTSFKKNASDRFQILLLIENKINTMNRPEQCHLDLMFTLPDSAVIEQVKNIKKYLLVLHKNKYCLLFLNTHRQCERKELDLSMPEVKEFLKSIASEINRKENTTVTDIKKVALLRKIISTYTGIVYQSGFNEDDIDTDEEQDDPLIHQIKPVVPIHEHHLSVTKLSLLGHINRLNNELKSKDFKEIDWSEYPKFYIAYYRGIHFHRDSNKFDTKAKRKNYRKTSHIHRSVHTQANYQQLGLNPIKSMIARETKLQHANNKVPQLFDQFSQSGEIEDTWNSKNGRLKYPSTTHLIHQRFTNSDQGFKQDLATGETSWAKAFRKQGISASPFCAVSRKPDHALLYAYGAKLMGGAKDQRLRPRFHQNGKPRHPYSGKVFVFMFTPKDLLQLKPFHVMDEHKKGNLNISSRIIGEGEVDFLGAIPQGYGFHEEVLQIPSFERYSNDYFNRYGISEGKFHKFKQLIAHSKLEEQPRKTLKTDLMGNFGNGRFGILIRHKSEKLITIAGREARRRGGHLIYANNNTHYSLSPMDTKKIKATHDIKKGKKRTKKKISLPNGCKPITAFFAKKRQNHVLKNNEIQPESRPEKKRRFIT